MKFRHILTTIIASVAILVHPLMCNAFVVPSIAAGQDTSPEATKLRTASYDGSWSGIVKCLYDPGLWPADECDVGFSFEIHGNAFSVQQVIRSKKGEETRSEVNAGKFRFTRLATNAVAVSLDSGNDDDGVWVETWSFVMTLKDPDHMIVHWTRLVNNLDMPKDNKGSKFSSVGMGELVRVRPKI